MLGLGAYASSSSGEEDEKPGSSPPKEATAAAIPASSTSTSLNQSTTEAHEKIIERLSRVTSEHGSVAQALLNDEKAQDPGFVAAAVKEYGIDPDATNLPPHIWNPTKVKETLPEILSALKAEELAAHPRNASDQMPQLDPDGATGLGDDKGRRSSPERRQKKAKESRWDK